MDALYTFIGQPPPLPRHSKKETMSNYFKKEVLTF